MTNFILTFDDGFTLTIPLNYMYDYEENRITEMENILKTPQKKRGFMWGIDFSKVKHVELDRK